MRTLHQALFSRNTAAVLGIMTLVASLSTGLNYVTSAFEAALPLESAGWHATASALAVELGVVFAGLTIAIRAREGDQNLRLYFAIVLFLAISMYANGDAVLTRMLGESPSWQAVVQMDGWSKARALLLGSAVPLMVLVALESLKELAQSDPSIRISTLRKPPRDQQAADKSSPSAGAARPFA